MPNQPIVIYAGDDRRSGRIFKWVSKDPYTAGMTKAEIRALLDEGTLYVAHFAGLDNATGVTMLATGQAPTEAAPGHGAVDPPQHDEHDASRRTPPRSASPARPSAPR